jgi:hypothetical protein
VGGEETAAVEGDEDEQRMVRPSLMRSEGSAVAKAPLLAAEADLIAPRLFSGFFSWSPLVYYVLSGGGGGD